MNQLIVTSFNSIEAYITHVNHIPMLTREKECELFERLQIHKDLEAAKELIYSHLRLVVKIAREHLGYGLPLADLIQEGNIGLMKAVKSFNLSHKVRLSTYAMHYIKSEINKFVVDNWRTVKIVTTKAHKKLFYNLRRLRSKVGTLSDVEAEDIALKLELKPSDVREFETRLSCSEVSLTGDSDNEDSVSPVDWLQDSHNEPTQVIERNIKQTLLSVGINEAIGKLDKRSQDIIQSRWLDDETKTLNDLALVYNVSIERIRQIEAKAIKQLRAILEEENER